MNITHEVKDNLTALISIEITENDYKEEVKKTLNDYRRNAQMPGFRPGKVPFGLINQMYGESVTAEKVYDKIGTGLDTYIREQGFKTLGQPLPAADEKAVNFKDDKDFKFVYEIGLKPEFEIEVDKKIKLDKYVIEKEEDSVDNYLQDLRKNMGTKVESEHAGEGDTVYGLFEEVDKDGNPVEGGLKQNSSLNIDYIKLKGVKDKFMKMKVGDTVIFNPKRALKNSIELARIFNIGLGEVADFNSDVRFTAEKIEHIEPAEINEEFFAKVYENAPVHSEEELRERIAQDIEQSYKAEGRNQFMNDIVDMLLQSTNLPLPDEFLKRWIIESNQREEKDKRISPEELEQQYESYRDTLRWQLIEEKLADTYGLKVSTDDIKARIPSLLGIDAMGGDDETQKQLIDYVTQSVMSNEEEVNKIARQIMEEKIIDLFVEKARVQEKTTTYDEFLELMSKKLSKKTK